MPDDQVLPVDPALLADLPLQIETDRLVIRRWCTDDASAVNEAIARSREHLLPWMPWAARPPMSIDERVEWFETTQADESGGRVYGIFDRHGNVLGGTGYHFRIGPGGVEIGYWVHVDHVRKGIATEASRVLTDPALKSAQIDRLEIHHDVANVASGRVPARLGYERIGEEPREVTAPGEAGRTVIWRVTRSTWVTVG